MNDSYDKALKKINDYKLSNPTCCCTNAVPTPTPTPTIDSILVDNDGEQSVAANNLVDLGEIINSTGTSITYTSPNTVTLEPGTYYILWECLVFNESTAGDIGASMLVNGVVAPNASEYMPATETETQSILQHNITVTADTTISILNASTVTNNYHDSSLSVIKLA